MRFHALPLAGAIVIEPEQNSDARGSFARLFDAELFSAQSLPTEFVQSSISFNHHSATLRGLHFQASPYAEAKLVRCTAGAMLDVIVDIRRSSPTFGRHHSVELTAQNRLALFIPKGFAHGFQTLADGTEVYYQMTQKYVPGAARGIAWNDPAIGIAWPHPPAVMSDRDRALLPLSALQDSELDS